MADNEIITQNDLLWFVQDATKLFSPDLISITHNYTTKIDMLLGMITQLQQNITQISNIDIIHKYNRQGESFHDSLNNEINKIYVDLTKIYYLLRTYLTGETISFLENIEGSLKVINQEDWLALLTSQQKTKWGTSTSKIFLLEQDLINIGTSINNSNQMAKIQNYNAIIDSFIEYGKFQWNNQQPVGSYNGHEVYQKDTKDTLVYAYYTNGKQSRIRLLYNLKIPYNLGELQETLVAQFEQLYASYPTVIDQLITNLQQEEHPIGVILHGWKRNSIPGLVEGDFKTASNQWIQSKRHNESVINTIQIHRAIINVKTYLEELRNSINTANQNEIIDKLANDFYNMFSSETTVINEKLRDKIRRQLPTLLGQAVL